MTTNSAVRKVLRESSDHENFKGWTFAERLVWMIERGFKLGRMANAEKGGSDDRHSEGTTHIPS